jgi:hypothetical protein
LAAPPWFLQPCKNVAEFGGLVHDNAGIQVEVPDTLTVIALQKCQQLR